MEIHLLRHGKTSANEKNLYCGRTDVPLSENGAVEIASLKQQQLYPPSDMFFTSGLLRAEQTVDIIYGVVNRHTISDMAEYDFGMFEMKSYEELKALDDYRRWMADSTGSVSCPGGESKSQFLKRITSGYGHIFGEALQSGADSIVVACHGGVIAGIMEYLFPNTQNFYDWHPKQGRGYTLTYILERLSAYKKI